MPPRPFQRDLFDPRAVPRPASAARTRAADVAPGVRCLRALGRRGWVVVAAVALSSGAAIGVGRWLQPIFQASASVELQTPQPEVQFSNTVPASPDPSTQLGTVAEELASQELVGETARELGPGITTHLWRGRGGPTDPEAWTAAALRQLQVIPVADSRIIRLRFQAPAPGLAARFLNQLVANDLDLERSRDRTADEARVSALWARSEAAGAQLAQAQEQARALWRQPGGNPPAALALAQQRQQQMATAETAAAIAGLQQSNTLAAAAPATTPPELEARQAELEGDIRRLAAQYQPAAAPLQQAEQELAGVNASLAAWQQQNRQAIAGALATQRGLERDLTAALARGSANQIQIERALDVFTLAQGHVQADQDTYTNLLEQLQQAVAEVGTAPPPLRVVDAAVAPASALRPEWPETLAYAVVLGLLVGSLGLWGLERLRAPVWLAEAGEMGVPLLAVLPSAPARFEACLEGLCAALLLAQTESGASTVLLTSADGGEGKTTVGLGLARQLHRAGVEVLLLDAHPRRPGVHQQWGGEAGPGLSELLAGQRQVEEVLRLGPQNGCWFIAAGETTGSSGHTLSLAAGAAAELLAAARQRYGWVVIDGPPILSGIEAGLWARLTDCTLVVAAEGQVSRQRLRQGLDQLEAAGASQLGLVLNRASRSAAAAAWARPAPAEATLMEMRQRA